MQALEARRQARAAIEFAARAACLGDPVGDDAQQFSRLQLQPRAAVRESIHRAQRRAVAVGDARDRRPDRIDAEGVLVSRVAVGERAGVEFEDGGERGDEQRLGIVARHFGVRRRHQGPRVRRVHAQRRALVQRLAHGHEDAGRQTLAGNVADQEEKPLLVQPEKS
ncbi:MAG: hypothetical protein IPI27_11375 [Betaproteobacteria bacterium]|nr:hypothetical protein [Betaproteobacteria bacterium]